MEHIKKANLGLQWLCPSDLTKHTFLFASSPLSTALLFILNTGRRTKRKH
jgi:hypothetical protein